jgi:protein ImuB
MDRMTDALYRLTPDVTRVTASCVAGEFSRVRSLYKDQSILKRLQVLLSRFDVSAQTGIASTLIEAYALTFYPTIKRLEDMPLEAIRLLVEESDSILSAMRDLGFRRLGELLPLSRSEILRRFGAQGRLLQDRLIRLPEADLKWKRAIPDQKIVETQPLNEERACAELEPLLFELKALFDRALVRLRSRGERLRAAEIELGLDLGYKSRKVDVRFSFPQSNVSGVLIPLREILKRELNQTPLDALVQELKHTVSESTPSESLQRQLFEDTDVLTQELEALLEQLEKKNGASHLFQYQVHESYIPEHSFKCVAADPKRLVRAETDPKLPIALRPSRILRTPEPLRRLGRYLFTKQERWTLNAVSLPELIQTEGWSDQPISRCYYRVDTSEGDLLWVFRDSSGLYLHGWFE